MANKNHTAWKKIFEIKQFDVSKDIHYITAKEMKAISGREPRHLAKIDSTKDLSPALAEKGYFPIAVKNGTYAIVRANGFHNLEPVASLKEFDSRINFNLQAMHTSTSEMQYLDYSHSAGLIERIINKGSLYPIIRGRTRSGDFSYRINDIPLDVHQVQIEVDLGLEGENSIVLLEGKSGIPEDFMVRQIYYPFRKYENIAQKKEIIPIFFTYVDNKYNFWIYEFQDKYDYNSLNLIENYSYQINIRNEISTEDIFSDDEVITGVIPQADDLHKIQELVFKVSEGIDNSDDMAKHFAFDNRQSSYYREAAEALGFVELRGSTYHLTEKGQKLVTLDTQSRTIYFSQNLLNFSLVRIAISNIETRGIITRNELYEIIADNSDLAPSTVNRRTSTLYAWLKWLALNSGVLTLQEDGSFFKSTK